MGPLPLLCAINFLEALPGYLAQRVNVLLGWVGLRHPDIVSIIPRLDSEPELLHIGRGGLATDGEVVIIEGVEPNRTCSVLPFDREIEVAIITALVVVLHQGLDDKANVDEG